MSRKNGCTMLTFHFKGACHLVKDFVCETPIKISMRSRNSQPRCVIAGDCTDITITDDVAFIR